MPSHENYHVAWVCALGLEVAAARVMLDREHAALPQPEIDQNSYVLGEVSGHNVVIVCLPSYGTISAATTIIQLKFTFRAIRFALLVGIGGAVPNTGNDIRLGDVVVSKPMGTVGGVVQYDFGKDVQGQSFQRAGCLDKPPEFLLASVANLESRYKIGKGQMARIIAKSLGKSPRIEATFRKPTAEIQDQLYRADYSHVAGQSTCIDCDVEQLIQRKERYFDEPMVHSGLIASGNRVMKDGCIRDRLADEIGNVVCFEMEAAGVMDYIPSLVIRGICDYSDSHKNKDWQPYAALTAAGYAKELLSTIPNSRIENVLPVSERPSSSPQARLLLKESFEAFEKAVIDKNSDDLVLSANSNVDDVYHTAREIERDLEAKSLLRNTRRITNLVEALARFKDEIAEIEDMSTYLTLTFGPILLALKVASEHVFIMEKLISVYDNVAKVLPRFEGAGERWNAQPEGPTAMVLILVNIIDLQREIYLLLGSKSKNPLYTGT